MRVLSVVSLVLIFAGNILAADSLYVFKKGGQVVGFNLTDLDSLTFYGNSTALSDSTDEEPDLLDSLDSVEDIDGNLYGTIKIGEQYWLAEDLKTTRFSNGDKIPTTCPPDLDISQDSMPIYQWAYDGVECNTMGHGRLYTWYVAGDSRNVCPSGWHVASDAEWSTLINFVGGSTLVGGTSGGNLLKGSGWNTAVTDTNSVGFDAKGSGYRDDVGPFEDFGEVTHFWTSTWDPSVNTNGNGYPGVYRSLVDADSKVFRYSHQPNHGFHIRCVKD